MKNLAPQKGQPGRRAWFMLAAAILFILIIRGITLFEPPARDQSTFLTMAGELKEGAVL